MLAGDFVTAASDQTVELQVYLDDVDDDILPWNPAVAPAQHLRVLDNRFVRERPETAAMSNSFFAPKLTPKSTPSCQLT